MPSKLKPLVLLGIVGGIVAAVRKRAAGTATDIADRAKEAVSGTPEDTGSRDETRRFAHAAEAEAQAPSEPAETPSEESQATVARSVPPEEPKP